MCLCYEFKQNPIFNVIYNVGISFITIYWSILCVCISICYTLDKNLMANLCQFLKPIKLEDTLWLLLLLYCLQLRLDIQYGLACSCIYSQYCRHIGFFCRLNTFFSAARKCTPSIAYLLQYQANILWHHVAIIYLYEENLNYVRLHQLKWMFFFPHWEIKSQTDT